MTVSRSRIIVNSIAAIFIFLFTYTAFNKLLRIDLFRHVINQSFLHADWAGFIAWAVVLSEWLAVLLLIYPPARMAGLWLSAALMLTFTIYIGIMLATSSHLPCSCGGILKQLSWKNHFWLNIILTALAVTGIVLGRRDRKLAISNVVILIEAKEGNFQ